MKKERNILCSFAKERNILAFFPVLCKRTERSLHSFLFFWKEQERTFRSFGSHKSPKTQKRTGKKGTLFKTTGKNGTFFKRTGKNGTFWTGKNAVPNPAKIIPGWQRFVQFRKSQKVLNHSTLGCTLWSYPLVHYGIDIKCCK